MNFIMNFFKRKTSEEMVFSEEQKQELEKLFSERDAIRDYIRKERNRIREIRTYLNKRKEDWAIDHESYVIGKLLLQNLENAVEYGVASYNPICHSTYAERIDNISIESRKKALQKVFDSKLMKQYNELQEDRV